MPAPARSTWRSFLGQYREYIVACDFFTVDTVFLQRQYVLFFIKLGSRRVHLAGCATTLDAAWVMQQAQQFSWHLQARDPGSVRYLLHDRDGKFAAGFDTVSASEGIEVVRTPVRAPNANAVAERVIHSILEECPDRLLVVNEPHLRYVLKQYLAYYNHHRPHQGQGQRPPAPIDELPQSPAVPEQARCRPVLRGIIHDYAVAA